MGGVPLNIITHSLSFFPFLNFWPNMCGGYGCCRCAHGNMAACTLVHVRRSTPPVSDQYVANLLSLPFETAPSHVFLSPEMDSQFPDLRNTPSKVHIVQLRSNQITNLPADAFKNLKALYSFTISKNRITKVWPKTFDGLNQLECVSPFKCA